MIFANGEIYNHASFRDELGHAFNTESDSEAALAVVLERGAQAIGSLRGMFALVIAGEAGDLLAAHRIADHLALDHTERTYTADEAVAALPEVTRSLESCEPSLVRSAVPNYFLAARAACSVKAVLTGEGADELFAGYHHLRALPDDELRTELERSVRGPHNLNRQRCDRVTMAHGLEARVPFLDLDVVALAERIPIGWRLPGTYGEEKALLREAFAGWLPRDLLWRPKEQFGDGSGTADVITKRAATLAPSGDWTRERVTGLEPPRSHEELAYQRLFAEQLGGIDVSVLGRFATA